MCVGREKYDAEVLIEISKKKKVGILKIDITNL